MKKSVSLALLSAILVLLIPFRSQVKQILRNENIIEMTEKGLDPLLIITMIESYPNQFRVDPDELVALTAAGVSPEVASAMICAGMNAVPEKVKSGIFVYHNDQETMLYPTAFSGSRSDTFVSEITAGIANANVKSTIPNVTSPNVIYYNEQEFYFYFVPSENDLLGNSPAMGGDWWFRTATSPAEFVLVKLEVNNRRNERRIRLGRSNVAGSSIGVDSRRSIPFDIEEVELHVYKVTPHRPMGAGEYAFFYQGTIPLGGVSNQSVFDFSIR